MTNNSGFFPDTSIFLKVDRKEIQMGESVNLYANVNTSISSVQIWTFVNGLQWGSGANLSYGNHESVRIILPLPNIGNMSIQLANKPPPGPYYVGKPIPTDAVVSNTVVVQVLKRIILRPEKTMDTLFGMEWEPWFTPLNAKYNTAEGVPLVGLYDSYNKDVIRQHAIWFAESGIDFLLIDWTNNIWGLDNWDNRSEGVKQLIESTRTTLSCYLDMKNEGLIPVPQFLLLLGLDNGPTATMDVLNQEILWIHHNFSEFRSLWLTYLGKPLMVPFDGGNLHTEMKPINDSYYTIRWMSTQFQSNHLNKQGFWSWMDGSIDPQPTFYDGYVEALTITNAFFRENGWLGSGAMGQSGGVTLLSEFQQALKYRPKFLIYCQWNEFLGQVEGSGPNHDMFSDIYNVSFSNDMEPLSMIQKGFRSWRGGWGFYFVNLLRALFDLYQQSLENDQFLLIAISNPERLEVISTTAYNLQWTTIGSVPDSIAACTYSIQIDGVNIVSNWKGNNYLIDFSSLSDGNHWLTILVERRLTYYPLSSDRLDDVPLKQAIPLQVQVEFIWMHEE